MLIYKYTKLKNLLSSLENGIFASIPKSLNDPYEYKDIETSGIRVCCLSKSRNAKLMWSHYADGHRGCSIGIEIPPDFDEPNSVLKKVKYEKLSNCKNIVDPVERLYYKDPKWQYEKEIRAVYRENDNNQFWQIKDQKVFLNVRIKQVALGCSVDLESPELIESLIWIKKYNDAQKFKRDRIDVIKYKALDSQYRFEKDSNFDFEKTLDGLY